MGSYPISTRVEALNLKLAGYTSKAIQKYTGVHKQALYNLYKKALSRGFDPEVSKTVLVEHVVDGRRCGRPSTRHQHAEEILKRALETKDGRRKTYRQIGLELNLSPMTIHRTLKEHNCRESRTKRHSDSRAVKQASPISTTPSQQSDCSPSPTTTKLSPSPSPEIPLELESRSSSPVLSASPSPNMLPAIPAPLGTVSRPDSGLGMPKPLDPPVLLCPPSSFSIWPPVGSKGVSWPSRTKLNDSRIFTRISIRDEITLKGGKNVQQPLPPISLLINHPVH